MIAQSALEGRLLMAERDQARLKEERRKATADKVLSQQPAAPCDPACSPMQPSLPTLPTPRGGRRCCSSSTTRCSRRSRASSARSWRPSTRGSRSPRPSSTCRSLAAHVGLRRGCAGAALGATVGLACTALACAALQVEGNAQTASLDARVVGLRGELGAAERAKKDLAAEARRAHGELEARHTPDRSPTATTATAHCHLRPPPPPRTAASTMHGHCLRRARANWRSSAARRRTSSTSCSPPASRCSRCSLQP